MEKKIAYEMGKKSRKKWGKKSRKNQEKNVEKKMQDGDISKCRKNFGNETQKKIWG